MAVWYDLLQRPDETITVPWIGGRNLRVSSRSWKIRGTIPSEHGWYRFKLDGRKAVLDGPSEPDLGILMDPVIGYLVGDRIMPDHVRVDPDPASIAKNLEKVHLIESGLDRFARIRAARWWQFGPLVFVGQEMPLGPEDAVMAAYLDDKSSVDDIPGVPPALDAAFRLESWQRREVRRAREEETKRLAQEKRRRELLDQLGDATGRRTMALEDFSEAARAALAIGGAVYLDHRPVNSDEVAVRFRFLNRRFECTCDLRTLRIIDSGICLQDEDTGYRGDHLLTLESLPSVIGQADREGKLVVFRHV